MPTSTTIERVFSLSVTRSGSLEIELDPSFDDPDIPLLVAAVAALSHPETGDSTES